MQTTTRPRSGVDGAADRTGSIFEIDVIQGGNHAGSISLSFALAGATLFSWASNTGLHFPAGDIDEVVSLPVSHSYETALE